MERQDQFNIGEFDREYNLTDLLPVTLATDLLGEVSRHVPMAIILPDGRIHCDLSHGAAALAPAKGRPAELHAKGQLPFSLAENHAGYFPLRHELEDIGYLVISAEEDAAEAGWACLGEFIARAVNHIIHLMYRVSMTAGLHVQVVEESYGQLKDKAERLQCSEEKYRKLSESLEVEVARKTEKIKTAQLMLLQQEKLASIGQLAAGMAHEINNPIGFIISNLNTLGANVHDTVRLLNQYRRIGNACDDAGRHEGSANTIAQKMAMLTQLGQKLDIDFIVQDMQAMITECLEGAGRINAIVENLRNFAHPSVETLEKVDINHCLDTTLSILSGQIAAGISIRTHYQDIPSVSGHLRELNQVFFHILRNALQALEERGELTIGTGSCDDKTIEVVISDTGTGIAKAHRAHLFEPFFTTRPVGNGTGLGLHLAHNIIKKHGGSIEVVSEEGSGSVFTVRIPIDGPQGLSEPADRE